MNRKVLAGAAVLAAAGVAFVVLQPTRSNRNEEVATSSRTTEPVVVAGQSALSSRQLQHDDAASGHKVADPFPTLPRSRAGMPMDNDPFKAESVAEQRWLDRNGYPNAEQWRTYMSANDMLLEQAAASGDKVAAVVLDSRALTKGDKEAGTRLMHAAEGGSTFALSMLAAYMAASPKGDPRFGYALSRVQEMMGDTRVALARDAMFPKPVVGQARIDAEAQALQIFDGLRNRSSRRPFVDPRPFPG